VDLGEDGSIFFGISEVLSLLKSVGLLVAVAPGGLGSVSEVGGRALHQAF
jgi:hypothetical protein